MGRFAALLCAVVLGCGVLAAGAGAEAVAPTEGPWRATTSAGLPVGFEVKEGQAVGVHYGFKWGFCGSYTSHAGPPVPIDPEGHFKFEDSGTYLEATFTAPDRAEGIVVAPDRELPGCPHTEATFTAEPGAAPVKEPETVVLATVGKGRYAKEPETMVIKRDGSMRFEGLRWHGWGENVATATGRAFIGAGRVARRPKVKLTLQGLATGGPRQTYVHLRYTLQGRVPPGFSHKGERLMEEYARR
jgi:hypothetical protein